MFSWLWLFRAFLLIFLRGRSDVHVGTCMRAGERKHRFFPSVVKKKLRIFNTTDVKQQMLRGETLAVR